MEFFPALMDWAGHIFIWLAVLQLLALLIWPLVSVAASSLDDRGYFLSKALALVLLTFLTWALQYVVGYGLGAILLSLVVLAALSLFLVVRGHAHLAVGWRHLLQAEGVFLAVFLAFLFIQMYHPFIEGQPIMTLYTGERFMDSAFMNSILRSDSLPPEDPWLAGHRLYNYYYLGYLMGANLSQLTTIPVRIAFNLGTPTLAALTAMLAFGVVRNMTGRAALGLVAVLFLVFFGNMYNVPEIFDQLLDSPSQTVDRIRSFWDDYYWAPTRALFGTNQGITEFPFFTFMWGSFHPNAIGIPFQVLVIGLLLAQARSGLLSPQQMLEDLGTALRFAVLGISLGFLFANNAWDYPTYSALTAFALFFMLVRHGARWTWAALVAVTPILISLVAFAPFMLEFDPAATEWFPLGITDYPSPVKGFILIFGFFLFVIASYLLAVTRPWAAMPQQEEEGARAWGITLLSAGGIVAPLLVVGAIEFPLLLVLSPLVALALWALYQIMRTRREGQEAGTEGATAVLTVSLILAGLGVAAFAEVFFVKDYLQEGEFQRMNSVFKFYSQIWVLWAIAAAFAVPWVWRGLRSWLHQGGQAVQPWMGRSLVALWALPLTGGILLSLMYAPLAINSWTRGLRADPTLDGTLYLREMQPGDYFAIDWLNRNVEGQPRIVEAVPDQAPWQEGFDYTYFSRVSSLTGLPTIVGWVFHEFSWGMKTDITEPRIRDVVEIYVTPSPERAADIMRKYGATFVFLGSLERQEYPGDGLAKFEQAPHLFEKVYDALGVQIFRLQEART